MSILWLKGNCPDIRELTDSPEDVALARIVPLVRDGNGRLSEIVPVDLRRTAFTWDPDFTVPVDEENLVEVARIETNHKCGYIAFFKPSVAEVLVQIPRHFHRHIDSFEVLQGDTVGAYSGGDGHRTVTVLYRRDGKSPLEPLDFWSEE